MLIYAQAAGHTFKTCDISLRSLTLSAHMEMETLWNESSYTRIIAIHSNCERCPCINKRSRV